MAQSPSLARNIALSVLLVGALLAVLVYFEAQSHVLRLLEWLDAQGVWGPFLFILIMALVVVLVLPGVMFTTGAGFLFGVVEGTLYVIVGTTLGATIAFLIARYLIGDRASRFLLSHPKLKRVDDEFIQQDWKIVLLTRLVPFFPFKLSNYVFGLMRFSSPEATPNGGP